MPRNVGETNYSILTQKEINLLGINPCLDTQSDRQKGKSGCSFQHSSTNHISSLYELNLEFPVTTSLLIEPSKMIHQHHYSHWIPFSQNNQAILPKLQHLLHPSHTTRDQESNSVALRLQINNMVQHINVSGGWTIVCRFMMGSTINAATNSTKKIQNNEITIHISYLYPTDADKLFQTDEYKELLLITLE